MEDNPGHDIADRLRLLESVVVHARDAVVVTDFDDLGEPRIIFVNPAFTEQTGYAADEVVGKHPRLLVRPDSNLEAQRVIRDAVDGRRSVTVELLHYRRDGTSFWVENSINPVSDGRGRCTHIVSIQRDVTERKLAADAIQASERRFRLLVQNASDIITVVNGNGSVRYSSPAATRVLGYEEGFRPDQSVLELVHPDDVAHVAQAFARCIATPGVAPPVQFRMRHDDGRWIPVEAIGNNLLDDPAIEGVVVTTRDISDWKQAEEALAYHALHDPLTGLPNRSLLGDRLAQALVSARREHSCVGLLLMDLDRFKEINDTLGHKMGDLVLEQVARRMEALLRSSDTVARLGGDEFAVILEGLSGDDEAEAVTKKVLGALERPFDIAGIGLHVPASIGIAMFPGHGEDPAVLLQRADVAMYRAKALNGGYAVYTAESDDNRLQRLATIADLRAGVERDELVVHYQPIVDAATGRVRAAEALARWRHPDRGVLSPAEFIPLAEQTGLIRAVTIKVLDAALSQAKLWVDEGLVTPVAVNLSAQLLHDVQLPRQVLDILARVGLEPAMLELEVTESAVMNNPELARGVIAELAATGVRFSVDDFGTGYSSLSHLRSLPVDQIKIDKSFVAGMTTNEKDASIVRTVIDLGHNLGLRVVAEGVETAEVLAALVDGGCDYLQGHLLGAPCAASQLTGRLAAAVPARPQALPIDSDV